MWIHIIFTWCYTVFVLFSCNIQYVYCIRGFDKSGHQNLCVCVCARACGLPLFLWGVVHIWPWDLAEWPAASFSVLQILGGGSKAPSGAPQQTPPTQELSANITNRTDPHGTPQKPEYVQEHAFILDNGVAYSQCVCCNQLQLNGKYTIKVIDLDWLKCQDLSKIEPHCKNETAQSYWVDRQDGVNEKNRSESSLSPHSDP